MGFIDFVARQEYGATKSRLALIDFVSVMKHAMAGLAVVGEKLSVYIGFNSNFTYLSLIRFGAACHQRSHKNRIVVRLTTIYNHQPPGAKEV